MSIKYIAPNVEEKIPYWNVLNYVNEGWYGIENNISSIIEKEDNETPASYDYRKNKLVHFNNFTPILNGIKGLVFAKPATLSESTPKQILDLQDDIDDNGTALNTFIGNSFFNAMKLGLRFIMIDSKRVDTEIKSQADVIKNNIRPYLVDIAPENVTAFKFDDFGLSMVKIKEVIQVDDEDNIYALKDVVQYRVLRKGTWELWQVIEDNDVLIDDGLTNLDFIPFYCLNLKEEGNFNAGLPFFDLAKLNIRHTEMFTDVAHSLHLANVPMLKLFGFSTDEASAIEIGANKAIINDNESATAEYLTLDTNAVTNTNIILEKLEAQMLEEGMKVLSDNGTNNNISATEANINAQQSQSKINSWINELENTFNNVLDGMAKFYALNDGGTINIDADILSTPLDAQEIQAYSNLVLNQGMSYETLFSMLKRRKNIVTDNEWEDENKQIISEGLLPIKDNNI